MTGNDFDMKNSKPVEAANNAPARTDVKNARRDFLCTAALAGVGAAAASAGLTGCGLPTQKTPENAGKKATHRNQYFFPPRCIRLCCTHIYTPSIETDV